MSKIPVVAKFEKVSYEQFEKDVLKVFEPKIKEIVAFFNNDGSNGIAELFNREIIKSIRNFYDNIKIPVTKTKGSMGHDILAPFDFELSVSGVRTLLVPTGLKCSIDEGWGMAIVPRSSLGFNYRIQLDNTIGIIDADYYNNPKNEGHIMLKISIDSYDENKEIKIAAGDGIAQAILLPYGKAEGSENITTERVGGIGSTNEQK